MADEKCYECGKTFEQGEMFHYENSWVCANCKPIFVQKIKEGLPLSGALNYAGFWIRFAAKMLDNIIITIINFILILSLMAFGLFAAKPAGQSVEALLTALTAIIMLMPLLYAIPIVYITFFLGKYGATPGKMVCNLKVVTAEGKPLSYGGALGRALGDLLSQMTFSIGYIIAAFDEEKRALHDRICNTRVIKIN